MFPSPMGIMSVSMMQELMMMINNPGFPSPMGIMSVSIREIRKRNIEQQEGFRPLWGSCLSQSGSQRYGQERQSFRPLWGSCLSQYRGGSSQLHDLVWFPSPMGIMSVSIAARHPLRPVQGCFRPLWGSCLSQYGSAKAIQEAQEFPSPMGIMSVSIPMNIITGLEFEEFPSPMGIMSVSITGRKDLWTQTPTVSVPYGDHVCLNNTDGNTCWVKTGVFPSPMGIMSVSMSLRL